MARLWTRDSLVSLRFFLHVHVHFQVHLHLCFRNFDLVSLVPVTDHYSKKDYLEPVSQDYIMESYESIIAGWYDWIHSDRSTNEGIEAELREAAQGFNPRTPSPSPAEPIYFQCPPEQEERENATTRGDIFAVKRIIQKWRAEPRNKQKSPGFLGTSLLPAIKGGHLAIAAYLIESGLSVPDHLFQAAMDMESYAFLELFLHHGFDINKSWSEYYSTPLAYSFENEEMTRWLLDHGADPNAESRLNNTPLSRAIHFAPMSIIELFFDRGGPDCMNHGELLHCGTYRNLPDRIEVLELLFTKGAQRDINKLLHEDRPGLFNEENFVIGCEAPLHVAARTGKLDVVKFLVAHGADTRKPDGKGRLPIDRARKADQNDVVQYLAPISVHQPRL